MLDVSGQPSRSAPILGHVPELDGLRGIAVGLVLLLHLWPNVGWWSAGVPFTKLSWIGVEVFFRCCYQGLYGIIMRLPDPT